MAREINRRFDPAAAAVYVTIEDELGTRSVHTIQVLRADEAQEDVEEIVKKAIDDAAARAKKVRAAFCAAGWKSWQPSLPGSKQ